MRTAMRSSCQAIRLILGAALLASAGCGPRAYVRKGLLDHPPRRIAILPFVITYAYDLTQGQDIPASHRLGRDLFRKTFYHAFATYGYEDVKLSEVDEKLTKAWGPIEDGQWRTASPQALGSALGADALIYGEVERAMHFSTPLYTETSLMATLRMVDARTGDELWRQKVQAAERGGALAQKGQVVDFLQDQVHGFNPKVKFLHVADLAVKQALKGMPNPPLSAAQPESAWSVGNKRSRLVILPLGVKRPQWQKGAQVLRTFLASNLQEGPFEIIELQRVDDALRVRGWKEGEPLPAGLGLSEVARQLGADSVLRGTVTDWGRHYLVLESWVKAAMQLELLDAQSGEVIWSKTKKNSRTAGLLKGPTGFQSIAIAPIMGLKTSHLERVANELTRTLANDLVDSPTVKAYVSAPTL